MSSADLSQKYQDISIDNIYGFYPQNMDPVALWCVSWRPDGKQLTYIKSSNNQVHIMGYDVGSEAQPTQLFNFGSLPRPDLSDQKPLDPPTRGVAIPQWRLRLLNQTGLQYFMWSPDCQSMLVSGEDPCPIYLLDVKSGRATKITSPGASVSDYKFTPDGRMVSYVADYNIHAVDLATLQTHPLTTLGSERIRVGTPDSLGELLSGEGHWWSPDGSRLAYLVTDERDVPQIGLTDFKRFNGPITWERYPLPGQPLPEAGVCVWGPMGQVWMDTSNWPGWLLAHVNWLPDSRNLALQLLNRAQNRLVLLLANADTGKTSVILQDSEPTWINVCNDLWFFQTAPYFIWSSEKGSYRRLYLCDHNGNATPLTPGDDASVGIAGLDETNCILYYHAYPKPYIDCHLRRVRFEITGSRVRAFPPEDLTPYAPVRRPDIPETAVTTDPSHVGVHQAAISPDYKYFADLVSTVNQPAQLHLRTIGGAAVKVIEDNSESHYYDLVQVSETHPFEFITLKAAPIGDVSDNMPLVARILKPRGLYPGDFHAGTAPNGKYPALIYIYGGPFSGGFGLDRVAVNSWSHVPDLWLRMMSQQGFFILCVDPRGSSADARGHAFESPNFRHLGKVQIADLFQGIKYLRSLPFIDPDRIGIFGGSFGGFMVLNALLNNTNDFKKAIKSGAAFAPVTDWLGYDAIYTERYMGLPTDNADGYQNTAVTRLAAGLTGKNLLLIHGADDDNVHLTHSMRLLTALTATDEPCELMVYPGATHGTWFAFGNTAATLFERLLDFFIHALALPLPVALQPPNPTMDSKPADGKAADKAADAKATGAQATDAKAPDAQATDAKGPGAKTADNETADTKAADAKSTDSIATAAGESSSTA